MFDFLRHWYNKLAKKAIVYNLEKPRSDKWPTVRKHHLEQEDWCRYCGGTKDLQVHHIIPFHIHPDKELDLTNLITLCECSGRECHLNIGHLGNWKNFNSHVRVVANSPKVGVPASK